MYIIPLWVYLVKKKAAASGRFLYIQISSHVGEPFYRFCKVLDGFFGVSVYQAIPHTMLNMALQNDLPASVQRRFGRVDLG